MNIWQIKNDLINKVAMLVATEDAEDDDDFWEQFEGAGRPLHWTGRPKLEVFKEKRKKVPKPRADISPLTADGLALNAKARDALGEFLSQFGQLLELDVEGHVEYYFNPTNLIRCVDKDKSVRRASGAIDKPSFIDSAISADAAVFIDPSMPGDIYVNDGARKELERRIKQAGITGMSFVQVWGEPAVSTTV
ncbi:hypothetical protein [Dyella choica]|uniref:Uncharacterized protein n=1 Tax=Dyella choica TaxID=1927959 RepID=A0A3S0PI81_9GAMM|nr:hypothetical protein [Dyella choica]RUL68512.1 hypothetical protein EKH80_23435 [Dyella choica]